MNTFKIGGVHPEPNKLTADRKIETLALPTQADPFAGFGAAQGRLGDIAQHGALAAQPVGVVRMHWYHVNVPWPLS